MVSIFDFVRAAKRLFKWLVEEGELQSNPAARLEKPRLPIRRRRGLPMEDRDRIIKAAWHSSARDYAICLMFADTGCRLGGMANLRLGDLELKKQKAVVTEKGPSGIKQRVIYFKPITTEAITNYLRGERPVCNDDHVWICEQRPYQGLTEHGIYQMVKRMAKRAGVKQGWNPHNWRHGAIRGMLEKGMPLSAASELAGHTSIQVTGDIYGTYPESLLAQMHDQYSWLTE